MNAKLILLNKPGFICQVRVSEVLTLIINQTAAGFRDFIFLPVFVYQLIKQTINKQFAFGRAVLF